MFMPIKLETMTICATARLVRGVLFEQQQAKLKSGALQWASNKVHTLQEWLGDLIGQAHLLGLIPSDALPKLELNPVAEAHLWELSIQTCLNQHEAAALFDIHSMAKSAIEANSLMLNWQLSEADINQQFMTQETRQFLRWRHTFEALCAEQGAIEPARLMQLQIQLFSDFKALIVRDVALPNCIKIAGFDRVTPLEAELFALLAHLGIELQWLSSVLPQQSKVEHHEATDARAECRAAVAWARQKLADNPQVQLAIISPALSSVRRELADLLDDTFHPESLHAQRCEMPRCYDFSIGLALTEYALVESALRLLRLASNKAELSFDDVTALLLDIYWGCGGELEARAQLDVHLRKNLSAHYRLETLIGQVAKLNAHGIGLDTLFAHLGQMLAFQNKMSESGKRRKALSLWMQDFIQLLDALSWATTAGLTSHEYQTKNAFYTCLKELASLDAIFGDLTASDALQKMDALCQTTMFQPEVKGDIHIQILGLLETPAVELDAVWAMNMNDHHWPPAVRLNPLLPVQMQRERGTPNASALVQSQFAALVHERLRNFAPQVVFSYAAKEADRELRPSPLLCISSVSKEFGTLTTLAERLAKPALLEAIDDFMAPPMVPNERVRGGVSLFAAQAKCPAWAFYQYRLGATKLETPVNGLDSLSRGNVLHQVLQIFWNDCQSLSHLKALTPPQLNEKIMAAIDQSIQALSAKMRNHIAPQILKIESNRLYRLMQNWLEVECERADFVVHACEKEIELNIEGLTLRLTIDRVDALADAGLVVIDYKTSSAVHHSSWAKARITEPQLPIYVALALHSEPVVAVSFAKIRTEESKFIGITSEEGVLPNVATLLDLSKKAPFQRFSDWTHLLAHWHTSLTSIALEIKSGMAPVTIFNEPDLDYCEIKPLLRLPERALQFEHMQASLMHGDSR